jgi:hypothetical protein
VLKIREARCLTCLKEQVREKGSRSEETIQEQEKENNVGKVRA